MMRAQNSEDKVSRCTLNDDALNDRSQKMNFAPTITPQNKRSGNSTQTHHKVVGDYNQQTPSPYLQRGATYSGLDRLIRAE